MANEREHAELSPSMLDTLAICPCYRTRDDDSRTPDPARERGLRLHAALEARLTGTEPEPLPFADNEEVLWALEWVRANTGDKREVEVKLTIERDFAPLTWGYADVLDPEPICPTVVDYKSGDMKDYTLQLAAYALSAMQRTGADRAQAVILYSRFKHVEAIPFTLAEAEAMVFPVLDAARVPNPQPRPNASCGYCANRWNCPALHRAGTMVVESQMPDISAWLPSSYNPAEIKRPEDMALLLELRSALETRWEEWDKSVSKYATAMLERGESVPGWKLQEKQSNREVSDILAAFQATGMSAEAFLACCKVRMGELEKTYCAEADNKAAAKRELAAKLEPLLEPRTVSRFLKRAAKRGQKQLEAEE